MKYTKFPQFYQHAEAYVTPKKLHIFNFQGTYQRNRKDSTLASSKINEFNKSRKNEAMYSRKDGVILRLQNDLTYDL